MLAAVGAPFTRRVRETQKNPMLVPTDPAPHRPDEERRPSPRLPAGPIAAALAMLIAVAIPARALTNGAPLLQLDAPSVNAGSPELLDRAGFPRLGGLAMSGMMDEDRGGQELTFGATPLGLLSAVRGGVLPPAAVDTSRTLLDRVAARVTLGGPLQQVDPRRAARASRITNHVTTELKCRLAGGVSSRSADVLAMSLAADNLATGYGLDRYSATLIGEHDGPVTLAMNAGYRIVERRDTPLRRAETKLGTGASWRLYSGGSRLRGAELGLASDCLLRNHARPDIWQDGARLELLVGERMRVSASVLRSSRAEMPGLEPLRVIVGLAHTLGRVDG